MVGWTPTSLSLIRSCGDRIASETNHAPQPPPQEAASRRVRARSWSWWAQRKLWASARAAAGTPRGWRANRA